MLSFFKRNRGSGSRIGVFVTPDGVAAAEVVSAPGAKPRLERCMFEARASGEQAARAIGRLASRRARAVNVLDPSGYRLLLVETPDVPPDELRAAVRWRIKDLIDFHIDDAVVDVFEMPAQARGGRNRTLYAVTAKTETVKQQIDLVESAGLTLDVVDIPELSLRNVAALLETADRGAALLYLAERRSTLLLVRQGVLYLARHVETGTASLAEAGELRGDLVAGLALEVRRSLDYFESHYEQTGITQVHTSGLDADDREHLARDLALAVNDIDLERLVDTELTLGSDVVRRCLPAIGAALRRDAAAA